MTIPTKPRVYSPDWNVPTSIGIWGGSAADRAGLAMALALRIDPTPDWLQVEDPVASADPAESAIVKRVAADHVFIVKSSDLAPNPELGNLASWIVREDIDSDARIRALTDFARLPNLAQNLLRDRSKFSPTKAFVIANSNLAGHLYPPDEENFRPVIDAMNEYATTIIFTATATPLPRAWAIDYMLQISEDATGGRRVATVECLQGGSPTHPGLFAARRRWALDNLIEELGRR